MDNVSMLTPADLELAWGVGIVMRAFELPSPSPLARPPARRRRVIFCDSNGRRHSLFVYLSVLSC
jgi:hypothetical protein